MAPDFYGDEGGAIETAKGLWQYGTMTRYFLGVPEMGHSKGVVFYWLTARVFDLFGFGVWQARLVTALAGIGITLIVLWLGKMWAGWRTGVVAGLFHATSYNMLLLERWCKESTLSAMFLLAAVLFVLVAMKRKNRGIAVLAGLMAGLSLVTKIAFAYMLVALLGFLIILVIMKGRNRLFYFTLLLVFIVGLAVPLAGWLTYYNYWSAQEVFQRTRADFEHLTTHTMRASRYTLTMFDFAAAGTNFKNYQYRTIWTLLRFFAWTRLRFLGLLGIVLLFFQPRKLPFSAYLVFLVGSGVAAYWLFDGSIHYYRPACVLMYLFAGFFIVAIWRLTAHNRPLRVTIVIGLLCVCLSGLTLKLPESARKLNHITDPFVWGPILSTDDSPNIETARWIKQNIPHTAICYGPSPVLSITELRYIPSNFDDYAEVYQKYHPRYFIINRTIQASIDEEKMPEPAATLKLSEIKRFTDLWGNPLAQIYRIEDLKSERTVLPQNIRDYLREFPGGRPPDFTTDMLHPATDASAQ